MHIACACLHELRSPVMIVGGPQRFIHTNTHETGAFASHETTQEAQRQQNMVPVKRAAEKCIHTIGLMPHSSRGASGGHGHFFLTVA